MSTAFTLPADQTWQTLLAGDSPFLAELTLAYSERRQAINQSAYTPTDGKDVSAVAYWTTLQNWLNTKCTSFIDHISGPLTPDGTSFLYFTLLLWRAAAGLNASGFRRVPEGVEWDGITDPVWSYGQMQAGDIIGPWIFEDLQKGFGALKWSIENPSLTEWKNKNSLNEGGSCAITRAGSEGEFPGLSWLDGSRCDYHHQAGYDMGSDYSSQYACECAVNARNYWSWNNFRSKVRYTFPGRINARQCDVYIRKLSPRLSECTGQTSYNDIDGIFGAAEPPQNDYVGIIEFLEALSETAASTISDKLWIENGTPSVMEGVTCETLWPPGGQYSWGGRWSWGCGADFYGCLSKWNFTNA